MSQSTASPATATEPRLRGRWLAIARSVWLLLAVGLFANFVIGIQSYYAQLRTVCTDDPANCGFSWLPTSANVRALHQMGLSVEGYAAIFIAFVVAVSLVFLAVGALVFWRKSDKWLGLLVSLLLVMFGCFGFTNVLQATEFPALALPLPFQFFITQMSLAQYIGLAVFLVTFPTGRFTPRWTWVIVLLWVAQFVFFDLQRAERESPGD
jgi:hypothetical protein